MGQNLSGVPTTSRRRDNRRQDEHIEAAVAAASRHTTIRAYPTTSRRPGYIDDTREQDRRLEDAIAKKKAELRAMQEAADRNTVQQQSVRRIALSWISCSSDLSQECNLPMDQTGEALLSSCLSSVRMIGEHGVLELRAPAAPVAMLKQLTRIERYLIYTRIQSMSDLLASVSSVNAAASTSASTDSSNPLVRFARLVERRKHYRNAQDSRYATAFHI